MSGWILTIRHRGGAPPVVIEAGDAEGVLAALAESSTVDQFNEIREKAWQR